MRRQAVLFTSMLIAIQLVACSRHRAARVETKLAEMAQPVNPDAKPAPDAPSADLATTFEELDQDIQARVARLNDMNFYSMDDNYSMNTWKGLWNGTDPRNRPAISSLLAEIRLRVDRMVELANQNQNKPQIARAKYLLKNADHSQRKMSVLETMSSE